MKRGSIHKKSIIKSAQTRNKWKIYKIQSNHFYFVIFWANKLHFKHLFLNVSE